MLKAWRKILPHPSAIPHPNQQSIPHNQLDINDKRDKEVRDDEGELGFRDNRLIDQSKGSKEEKERKDGPPFFTPNSKDAVSGNFRNKSISTSGRFDFGKIVNLFIRKQIMRLRQSSQFWGIMMI
jgi:hypothetical protein